MTTIAWLTNLSDVSRCNPRTRTTGAPHVAVLLLVHTLLSCAGITTPRNLPGDIPAIDARDLPDSLRALFRVQPAGDFNGPSTHAFLVRSGERSLAITAHHVLSSNNGDPVATVLRSPFDSRLSLTVGRAIPVTGAQTIGSAGSQHDMAAFETIGELPNATHYLEMAPALPALNDTVYVYAVLPSHPRRYRHPARVVVAHDSALIYVYTDVANANLTSGAAVLDAQDRVVGINVGTLGQMTRDRWDRYRSRYGPCCSGVSSGETVGLAVSVRSMRHHLGLPR